MAIEQPPDVDIIMPVRQEAGRLGVALDSIWSQDYEGRLHVFVALAPSTDGTGELLAAERAKGRPLTVVDNPSGTTPAGLNLALRAGSGDVVIRLDGHASIGPEYVRTAVEVLGASGAVNVGGRQVATGTTRFERAVAEAMTSVFGSGGARFHVGGSAADVDTVYLGAFMRRPLEAVGGYDDRLIRNQDYELNVRLRQAGGRIRFDPRLEVLYIPRSSLALLARQYFEYGYWKSVVARLHPQATRLRQLIPAFLPVALLGSTVLGLRWRPSLGVPLLYGAAVAGASVRSCNRRYLAVVYPTMHLSWGVGFMTGLVKQRAKAFRRPA